MTRAFFLLGLLLVASAHACTLDADTWARGVVQRVYASVESRGSVAERVAPSGVLINVLLTVGLQYDTPECDRDSILADDISLRNYQRPFGNVILFYRHRTPFVAFLVHEQDMARRTDLYDENPHERFYNAAAEIERTLEHVTDDLTMEDWTFVADASLRSLPQIWRWCELAPALRPWCAWWETNHATFLARVEVAGKTRAVETWRTMRRRLALAARLIVAEHVGASDAIPLYTLMSCGDNFQLLPSDQ